MSETVALDLLQAFVAVAETSSFSTAADRLGTSKATISRAIARLEDRVGAELVHRTTRQVALSTAGTALYERVAPHLTALRNSMCSLPELEEAPSGELRITAPIDVGATLLPEVVARFALRYPAVRVDAYITNRMVDLVGEGFDLAIRAAGPKLKDSSMTVRQLAAVEARLFASPTYVARRGQPREVGDAAHDWVLFRKNILEMPLRQARIVCDDFFFLRETLRAGAGIGPLPTFLAEPLVASGELVRALPSFHTGGGNFVMLYPAVRKVARKVTAFRDVLVETLRLRPITP
jgi:DNA-binding transcriptional LysR family regulator